MHKFLKLLVKSLVIVVFISLLSTSCHPYHKSISRKKLKRGKTYRAPVDNKNSVVMTMDPIVKWAE